MRSSPDVIHAGSARRADHRVSRRARVVLMACIVPALATSLGACGDVSIAPEPTPVVGTGEVVTEDRTAGDVERISVAAPIEVALQVGTPASVTLTAQPNILPTVKTTVQDGQLIVNVPSPGYTTEMPVLLTVITPTIDSVTLSGGAQGMLRMSGGTLRLDLSGEATMEGVGSRDALTLTASSDAAVRFAEMVVDTCTVAMSGGAEAELQVVSLLTGEASGGATITLTAPVAKVDVVTTSGASVQGP
jgi:hypothetical protein